MLGMFREKAGRAPGAVGLLDWLTAGSWCQSTASAHQHVLVFSLGWRGAAPLCDGTKSVSSQRAPSQGTPGAALRSELQVLLAGQGKGRGFSVVAAVPDKLIGMQKGNKNYTCIREVKT